MVASAQAPPKWAAGVTKIERSVSKNGNSLPLDAGLGIVHSFGSRPSLIPPRRQAKRGFRVFGFNQVALVSFRR
jgi:hypothetical protein